MKRLSLVFPQELHFSDIHQSLSVKSQSESAGYQQNFDYYLNAVCFGQTNCMLEYIQTLLKQTEMAMGRKNGPESYGQVAIDLDLVEWDGEILRPDDAVQDYYTICLKDIYSSDIK